MGSCLSSESRSPRTGSPMTRKRRNSRKGGLGSRNSSFDYGGEEHLHRMTGRMFLNGSTDIASLYSQQGKKGTNQDAMVVWENFGSRADTVFCGVFDGHGPYGHLVARRVRDSLPLKLRAQWEANLKADDVPKEVNLSTTGSLCPEDVPFLSAEEVARTSVDNEETGKQADVLEALKESFQKAFGVMDKELRIRSNIDCYCSGTTAVTLVKQGQDIVIGNVGDSRAILATRNENNSLIAVQLTVDLKPSLPEEAERIHKCKGRVFALHDEPEVARVWLPNNDSPGLAMARAFGDFCLKEYGLISVPEVSHRRITHRDEFIVLATDGIWDVLPNEEVVEIVESCPTRSQAARSIVESAVKAWKIKYPTSKVDDCAVICLFLDSDGYTACANNSKGNIPSSEKDDATKKDDFTCPTGLPLSGTIKMADDEDVVEDNDDDLVYEQMNDEIGQWTALEGVSRKDTLVDLSTYTPNKEDEEVAGGGNARKK